MAKKKTCHPSQKTQLFLWQLKFLRDVPLHRCEIWSWAEIACSGEHVVSCHGKCNSIRRYRILHECGCQKLTSSIPGCWARNSNQSLSVTPTKPFMLSLRSFEYLCQLLRPDTHFIGLLKSVSRVIANRSRSGLLAISRPHRSEG